MTDIIDLALIRESRSMLETVVEKRGLTYFLAKDGKQPLFSIEKSKVDIVVRSCITKLKRNGREVHPRALEHCQKELRRELIRRVTAAMLRVGY